MPHPDWIHIPTPGDHYSPSTGSAVMTVIYELNRCRADDAKHAGVIVNDGTYTDYYDVGQPILVPAATPPTKPVKLIDIAAARIGLPRFFSGQVYRPAVSAIASEYTGHIFVHNGPEAIPLLRKSVPESKIWLYAHNDILRTYGRKEAERLLSYADGIICVSDYIRRVIASQVPTSEDKLRVVLNGVNPVTFAPPAIAPTNPEPVILFVGRMVPEKGAHVLIDAAQRLAAKGLAFKVRIVGSQGFTSDAPLSEYERSLRHKAEAIKSYVEFEAFRPRDQIAQIFQSADIYVAASTWHDPCPLIVIEAMGVGLPVAAAKRGGIPEQGAGAAAFFDPDHPEELADILLSWLEDETLRKAVGQRSRARAEVLDWKQTYENLKDAVA